MTREHAIEAINDHWNYKPGWTVVAEKHDRFDCAIKVHFTYPAQRSDLAYWPGYEVPVSGGARASFAISVHDVETTCQLYRRLLGCIDRIDEHEAREFLRYDDEAFFQPHQAKGMYEWGEIEKDLSFGLA